MTDIKVIFAENLRKIRRKRGLTQEKLAEKAQMSIQYLALLELGRKFPSGEMLERLATALEIETFELLAVAPSANNELELLRQDIVNEINQTVSKAIKQDILSEINQTVDKAIKQAFSEERRMYKQTPPSAGL